MRIVSIVARYLLGLAFLVFGLNGLVHFIPQPAPANPLANRFLEAISTSHYGIFVFGPQIIAGALLVSGFFVPLALTLLAAELFNILAYHLTLEHGVAPALVSCALWVLVYVQYRSSFHGILSAKPGPRTRVN